MILLIQHKNNGFTNVRMVNTNVCLNHLTQAVMWLTNLVTPINKPCDTLIQHKNNIFLIIMWRVSMTVWCVDALHWWSGGAPWPLRCWSLVHWLACCAAQCFADQPEPLSRWSGGGGESLICCCSSLTHTPTDSQIQFNRLFDDSVSPK